MYLPPLNALRAFETAGRHQSFLLASREMHVSSASISRFVKMLEVDLGQTLFIRHANGVSLTKAGEQYLLDIQPSLQNISQISEQVRQKNSKCSLKIISIPAIAETWLVSRLWSFQQQHKDIQINLVVDHQLVDNENLISLNPNDSTIILNYSRGDQADAESFPMPKDKLTLVCNQEVAQSLRSVNDILKFPLLVDGDWSEDWFAWLKSAGLWRQLQGTLPENHILFERYSMVLHATLAGSGIAIGHTTLLQSYLETGALVAPFDITTTTDKQFYALIAKNTQQESIRSFIKWFEKSDFS